MGILQLGMMIALKRYDVAIIHYLPLGCGTRSNLIEPIERLMVVDCVGTWLFFNGTDIKVCTRFTNLHHVTKTNE
jgi:hypothetical protein